LPLQLPLLFPLPLLSYSVYNSNVVRVVVVNNKNYCVLLLLLLLLLLSLSPSLSSLYAIRHRRHHLSSLPLLSFVVAIVITIVAVVVAVVIIIDHLILPIIVVGYSFLLLNISRVLLSQTEYGINKLKYKSNRLYGMIMFVIAVVVLFLFPTFPTSSPLFADCRRRRRQVSLLPMMMDDGPGIINDDTTTSSFSIVLFFFFSFS